jgi:hypothetical protein
MAETLRQWQSRPGHNGGFGANMLTSHNVETLEQAGDGFQLRESTPRGDRLRRLNDQDAVSWFIANGYHHSIAPELVELYKEREI